MSPEVAQSVGGQVVEFTSAFGGVAEVHGPTASAAFDANDPSRPSAVKFAVMHNIAPSFNDVVACGPQPGGEPVKPREFIALLGSTAAAWPLAARAQQPAMLLIGYLSGRPAAEAQYLVDAFDKGLREGGFIIGQNAAIEFRWADGQYGRLVQAALKSGVRCLR
jgi:hypothetical protein